MSKTDGDCPTWVEPLSDDGKLRTDERVRNNLLRHAKNYAVSYDQCFAHQSDITLSMRSILLCWMRDVCSESQLVDDTYVLACSLVDRHSAVAELQRSYYQLVGGTCLLIASKLRDPSPIETPEIVQYTVRTVTREQLFEYERLVVSSLHFDLESVTAWDLVCYIIRLFIIPNIDDDVNEHCRQTLRSHAKKFVYAIASEKVYLDFSPTVIAAASIAFSVESVLPEFESEEISLVCTTFVAESCELLQAKMHEVKDCLSMVASSQRDSASSNPALNDLPMVGSLQIFSQPAYAAVNLSISPLLSNSSASARISSDMSAGSSSQECSNSFVREQAFLHSSPFSSSMDTQTRHVSFAGGVSVYEDEGNESAGRNSAAVTPSKLASLSSASSGYASLVDEKENVKASESHFVEAAASSPQSSLQ